jgi:hypothetical protein
MRASQIWDEVRVLVEARQTPVIEIEPGAEIRTPSRPRGRPRKNPPWDRFAGWRMKTPSGLPMRCRLFGCSKPLRKDQVMTCSERCRDELLAFCKMSIEIIEGRCDPMDLPPQWRSTRLGKKPRRRPPRQRQ